MRSRSSLVGSAFMMTAVALMACGHLNYAFTFHPNPYISTTHVSPRNSHPCTFRSSSAKKSTATSETSSSSSTTTTTTLEEQREKQKEALLGLLNNKNEKKNRLDPVLVCPKTQEPLSIRTVGPILGGEGGGRTGMKVILESDNGSYTYGGRTDTYLDLLYPVDSEKMDNDTNDKIRNTILNSLPAPIRSILPGGGTYVPMRDLFTSPSVSFAYERGWRQNFSNYGFPGPDKEAELVKEWFAPVTTDGNDDFTTVVDMSCATGLFTRRLAKSNLYNRVIGCDYSSSMLLEARNRIRSDPTLSSNQKTRLELVRCDVAAIPLKTGSIQALHAGAAMHCWPDLDGAFREIKRVLKPEKGRFFATTFLANYFRVSPKQTSSMISSIVGDGSNASSMQAFQYFEDVEEIRDFLIKAGFEDEKIDIEIMGKSCVVVRCET